MGSTTPKMKPRLVAVPLIAVGHATPMMHLCSYLHDHHNFAITFVMIKGMINLKQKLEERGTWPPPGSDITLVDLDNDVDVPVPQVFNAQGRMDIYNNHLSTRINADGLERLVSEIEGGVSAIIGEYQYSWVMEVAEKVGIRGAILFTGCATWTWFDMNIPWLVSEGLIPVQDELLTEEEDSILTTSPLPPLRRSDIPWHFWNDTDFQKLTAKYNVCSWDKATWVLVNTVEVLEVPMIKHLMEKFGERKYLPIGPLLLANEQRNSVGIDSVDRSCIDWLDEQANRSVLYIAFGSVASLTAKQFEEFVLGLEASQQRFLWVVRSAEGLPDCYGKFLEVTKGRGMVVPWSPQLEVLSHDAVGGFITHCGWNSTLEGVSSGQAMICWPCLFDQHLNARLVVEDWKVGTWMTRGGIKEFVKRSDVERVIRLVMEGDEGKEMRMRAQEMKKRVQESMVGNGASISRLEAFANQILFT